MSLFFDTNILIDVSSGREPWAEQSAELVALVDEGFEEGYLCATTVTTMDYHLTKHLGVDKSRKLLAWVLERFVIANVDQKLLFAALESGFSDFEDAVLHEAACRSEVEAIVTRDRTGFKNTRIPIYHPQELYVIEFPPAA